MSTGLLFQTTRPHSVREGSSCERKGTDCTRITSPKPQDLLEPVFSEDGFETQAPQGSSVSLETLQAKVHVLIAAGEETVTRSGVTGLEDSKEDGREWK